MQTTQISRVANLLGGLAVSVVDDLGIGTREAALLAVDSHPGRTVAHLSRALGRSHSAVVRVVDGLVADGLMTRERGVDVRSVSIVLTREGQRQVVALRRRRTEVLDHVVGGLSTEERHGLEAVLEKLLAASARDPHSRWRICRLCEEPSCEISRPCPVDATAPPDDKDL